MDQLMGGMGMMPDPFQNDPFFGGSPFDRRMSGPPAIAGSHQQRSLMPTSPFGSIGSMGTMMAAMVSC